MTSAGGTSTSASASASASAAVTSAPPSRDFNVLIVMRHSKRIDQHPPPPSSNLHWGVNEFLRPYDPPICDFNLPLTILRTELVPLIPQLNVRKIVTSPFLRCVQTSAVIGRQLGVREYEIDARLGESKWAVNRCIKEAKRKLKVIRTKQSLKMHARHKPKLKYQLPDAVPCESEKDVAYLSAKEIREVIEGIYDGSNSESVNNDDIAVKPTTTNPTNSNSTTTITTTATTAIAIAIEWTHREPVGNREHIMCVAEWKQKISDHHQQQQSDGSGCCDVLMVTHGDVVSSVYESFNRNAVIAASECGWLLLGGDGGGDPPQAQASSSSSKKVMNVNLPKFSPSAIEVIM